MCLCKLNMYLQYGRSFDRKLFSRFSCIQIKRNFKQFYLYIIPVLRCVYVSILFAIDHKNISLYTSLLKAVMIKNNYVCDVKYITTYTN